MAEKTQPPSPAADTATHPSCRPTNRNFSWVFLMSCMFLCVYLARAVFGPILPYIEQDFNITHAASTRMLLYLSIGYAIGILVSGFTATKVQPRFLVCGSITGGGIIMVCIGMTDELTLFAALLVILGLVSGHYLNASMSVIRDIVSPSQWSMSMAIHEVGPNASFLLVPVLAEWGVTLFGWRFVIETMGWTCVVAGLLFLLLPRGGRTPSPQLSFSGVSALIKNPMAWLFAWLSGIGVAGEIATYSVLTMYLTEERAMTLETAAYLLSLSRVSSPFTVFLGGWLCRRMGSKKSLAISLAAFAFSLLLMAAPWKGLLLLGMFLQPAVCAMLFPPIFTFLAEQFSPKDQPVVMALGMPLGGLLGIGIIPALLGLCGDTLSFAVGFIILASVVTITLPLLKTIRPAQF